MFQYNVPYGFRFCSRTYTFCCQFIFFFFSFFILFLFLVFSIFYSLRRKKTHTHKAIPFLVFKCWYFGLLLEKLCSTRRRKKFKVCPLCFSLNHHCGHGHQSQYIFSQRIYSNRRWDSNQPFKSCEPNGLT